MASVGVGPAGRTARPAPRAAAGRDLPVLTEGRSVALLVALTAVAFVLRAVGLGQGPFGDELFTVAVIGDGPGGVLDGIDRYEQNPPLYYYLSVLAPEASDPLLWPRVLSLLFATASVPLVFVLGRRTVGTVPGLIAAGILALSPFLIFYGTEARGYAAAMLFVLASTVALLAALRSGSVGHWALFWAASTAAMYTHYTSAFALAAQAVWALCAHPQRWRGLVVAELAVAWPGSPGCRGSSTRPMPRRWRRAHRPRPTFRPSGEPEPGIRSSRWASSSAALVAPPWCSRASPQWRERAGRWLAAAAETPCGPPPRSSCWRSSPWPPRSASWRRGFSPATGSSTRAT